MRSATVTAMVALLGGCGGSAPATLDDYYDKAGGDVCAFEGRCGVIGASEVATCASQYQQAVQKYLLPGNPYDQAIAAKRLAFDAAAANDCLSIYATGCNLFNGAQLRRCEQIFKGLVPPGTTRRAT